MAKRTNSGFSLVELMVSLSIIAIASLAAIQAQVLASRQNGAAERAMIAAALMRDFVENAQSWQYTDARINPAGTSCIGATANVLNETNVGNNASPLTPFTFTAGTDPTQGGITSALTLNGTLTYNGSAPQILTDTRYQLMWSSYQIQTVSTVPGCQAVQVQVVVRYSTVANYYKDLLESFIVYNSALLAPGGVPEQI